MTDASLDLGVSEDVTLKPHPNELESATNGDHTVQFTFTDAVPMFRLNVQGEPLDNAGWNASWTEFTVPADRVPAIARGEDTFTVEKKGARFQVTGEVIRRD